MKLHFVVEFESIESSVPREVLEKEIRKRLAESLQHIGAREVKVATLEEAFQ